MLRPPGFRQADLQSVNSPPTTWTSELSLPMSRPTFPPGCAPTKCTSLKRMPDEPMTVLSADTLPAGEICMSSKVTFAAPATVRPSTVVDPDPAIVTVEVNWRPTVSRGNDVLASRMTSPGLAEASACANEVASATGMSAAWAGAWTARARRTPASGTRSFRTVPGYWEFRGFSPGLHDLHARSDRVPADELVTAVAKQSRRRGQLCGLGSPPRLLPSGMHADLERRPGQPVRQPGQASAPAGLVFPGHEEVIGRAERRGRASPPCAAEPVRGA